MQYWIFFFLLFQLVGAAPVYVEVVSKAEVSTGRCRKTVSVVEMYANQQSVNDALKKLQPSAAVAFQGK